MDVTQVLGLVYTDSRSGTEFGVIRSASAQLHRTPVAGYTVFAEDESGNAFLIDPDGGVAFRDHETEELAALARTWADFLRGCAQSRAVQLDPEQVKSAWIDPAFAKQLGIEAPPMGGRKGQATGAAGPAGYATVRVLSSRSVGHGVQGA